MADEVSERIFAIRNLVKGISQGKYYIEGLYKDNGYPKVIGQGNFTQERYDQLISERQDLLTQYKEGMDYIKKIGTKGGYTEYHIQEAANTANNILNELENTDDITTVRFTKLPPKNG